MFNHIKDNLYLKSYLEVYEQYPIGIRFHLGIIDNHDEMKEAYESDNETQRNGREITKNGRLRYDNVVYSGFLFSSIMRSHTPPLRSPEIKTKICDKTNTCMCQPESLLDKVKV